MNGLYSGIMLVDIMSYMLKWAHIVGGSVRVLSETVRRYVVDFCV